MTIKELLKKYRYKNIFNLIYRIFLKEKKPEDIYNLDLNFYTAWKELIKTEAINTLHDTEIYITQIEDDLETPPEPIIDVCLIDNKKDELFALDFVSWGEIVGLKITNATSTKEDECLARILWEITFWGFSDSKISKEKAKLKESVSKEWREVEKDLGDVYNSDTDESI
jgi:hypothetical protein